MAHVGDTHALYNMYICIYVFKYTDMFHLYSICVVIIYLCTYINICTVFVYVIYIYIIHYWFTSCIHVHLHLRFYVVAINMHIHIYLGIAAQAIAACVRYVHEYVDPFIQLSSHIYARMKVYIEINTCMQLYIYIFFQVDIYIYSDYIIYTYVLLLFIHSCIHRHLLANVLRIRSGCVICLSRAQRSTRFALGEELCELAQLTSYIAAMRTYGQS